MEILIFTLNAIVIYLASDWIVRRLEQARDAPMKQRQLVFFAVFLVLALLSFELLRRVFAA